MMFSNAVALISLATLLVSGAFATPSVMLDTRVTTPKTLRQAAERSGRYFGAAIGLGYLNNQMDPQFRYIAETQFNSITPENEQKWEIVEPQQNVFNFTQAETIVSWAEKNDFHIRGHTLVWHSQPAPWVTQLTGKALEKAIVNHVVMVMTQFRGRIDHWDVLNEAFEDDGSYRKSFLYNGLGAGFIETSFRTARDVKDRAKLYYNDYNLEAIGPKSNAVYSMAKALKKKKLIDGVGFQAHLIVGQVPRDLQANLQRFVDLGLEVALTEVDIRTDMPASKATQAQHAKDWAFVTQACMNVKGCVGITAWGITDKFSWIPYTFEGEGYGLIWDEQYQEKRAYKEIIKVMKK